MMMTILNNHRPVFAPADESGATPPTPSAPSTASPTAPSPSPVGASSTPAVPATPSSAPTPQSAPTPAVPPTAPLTASSGAEDTSFDFSSIFDQPAEVGPEASDAPAVVVPPVPAGVQPPAAVVPPSPEAPPQASPGQPVQPQQPPVTVEAQVPRLSPADPMSIAQGLIENEQAAIDHASAELFALSREDIEGLESDATGTIPKLLARGFVKAQQHFYASLARSVPLMIQRHQEITQRHTKNEDKFYARWPDLNRDQHGTLVRQYGAVFRQMHPQATLEQMVEQLGPMVMMAANVTPTPRPVTPGTPQPVRPQTPPFVPAPAGAVGLSQPSQPGQYDWMGMHD